MEQKKEYYAFISYKREDERWARWLQHKLEHYKLPSNLNGRTDLPREIRPVFRDTSELNPGNLPQQIHNALATSQHLIVICSPRSAQSEWVNLEIETFIAMGKQDRIIPFIVDGHPFANDPAEECFPPAIRNLPKEQELLGANVNEMGRDAAAVKTVAQMFGVRFDTLWQRYEREQRRKRIIIIAAVALFVFAVMGVAAYIWRQNKLITKSKAELLTAYNDLTLAKRKTEQERTRAENERDRANQEKERAEMAEDSIRVQYGIIEQERNHAEQERDRANYEKYRAEQAEDSISKQYAIIEQTNNNLRRTIEAKSHAQSINAAEAAMKLIEDGDSYLAQKIAKEAMVLSSTTEAEDALRHACQNNTITQKINTSHINAAIFSPNGKNIVAASYDGYITIWDISLMQCVKELRGHTNSVNSVAFSPDGNLIASASSDKSIRIWDASSGKCLDTLISTNEINNVVFSSDGKNLVSAEQDGSVFIWDVSEKRALHFWRPDFWSPMDSKKTLSIFRPPIKADISPNGKYIVSVDGKYVMDLNTTTGETNVYKGHSDNVRFAYISPDSKLIASGSIDSTIVIWDILKKQFIQKIKNPAGVITASFSPNGDNIVYASEDKTIHIWDVKNEKQILVEHIPISYNDQLSDVHFSPDGSSILVASGNGNIYILNNLINKSIDTPIKTFYSEDNISTSFSPDGNNIITASYNGKVYIKDVKTGDLVKTLDIHKDIYNYAEPIYSPDGQLTMLITWEGVYVWNTSTGMLLHTLESHSASFSHDSKYIVSINKDDICIWDISTWTCKKRIKDSSVLEVSFSPDSKRIASSSNNGHVKIWDANSGKLLQVLTDSTNMFAQYNSVSFSSDGKYIVSSSATSGYFCVWDSYTGKQLCHIDFNPGEDRIPVTFSPNCRYIVSCGGRDDITNDIYDNYIFLWNFTTGKLLQKTRAHSQYIHSIKFSPDGRHYITSSSDGTIKIWDFPPIEDLIKETENRFKFCPLTSEERRKYYLE